MRFSMYEHVTANSMRRTPPLPAAAIPTSLGIVMLASGMAVSPPAQADEAAAATATGSELEEVVVTAEKRESTVQKTPFSITAISGSQLVEQGLASIEDVAAQTPGISMKQFSPGETEYEMRGLPSGGGSSATVGLYLNDVPMAAPAASFNGKAMIDPDLFDLERIEVLRGPQGTLYGAGSMGGTIRLITAPPKFDRFEGASQTIVSDTAHGGINWGQSAMVNLPLVDDKLAVRLVGTDKYNDGWIDRIDVSPFPIGPGGTCAFVTCTRGDVQAAPVVSKHDNSNWERLLGGRASIRYQATDALSIDLLAMYQGMTLGAFPQVDESVGLNSLAHYQPFDINSPFKDTFKVFSLAVNYDMGFAKLTSNTANWVHESAWVADASESTEYLLNAFYGLATMVPNPYTNADHTQQFSQELRLTSEGDGRLQWVAGAFFSDFKSILEQYNGSVAYADLSTGAAAANPTGILYQADSPYHIKQYAVFGDTSYRITDSLKATVGLRLFKYDSRLDYEQAGIYTQTGNATPFVGHVAASASGSNPKFNLSYEPSQNLTLYAEIAKGFRPGGVNLPAPVPPCSQPVPPSYGPDSIWNYEVGEKARLLNGQLTVNADFYYIRWNDLQQALTLPCSYPFTTNIGTAKSYGPEIEVNAQLPSGFSVSVNGSYTEARVTSVLPSLLGTTVGSTEALAPGMPVLNVPKYNVTAAINYAHPVSDRYTLTARVSATTTGPFYDLDYNVRELPGYTMADARIGLIGGPWAAYLFAHNLTDKIAILTIDTHAWSEPTPALSTPTVTTPRTVGLEVNYKF